MSENKVDDSHIFWLQDPTILYKNGNYATFFPSSIMTRIEQLNALTRLCIYLYVLLYLTGKLEDQWSRGILIALVLIVILFYIFDKDEPGKRAELLRQKKKSKEPMTDLPKDVDDMIIESGYYDTEGKMSFGRFLSHEMNRNKELEYNLDEFNSYKKASCKIPTSDNPFMNPLLTDYNNENNPEPCNADDEDIQNKMVDMFNQDLYRDLNDLFDVKNAQRQFYTVPGGSIPNDQQAFAEWLYKSPPTCKEDNYACIPRNDYRFKSC
jgi:hypothetical protein